MTNQLPGDAARRAERGFSLLEMMVALAIFAIAALALIKLQGASVAQTAELDRRLYAEIALDNLAVDAITDPLPPALGETKGTIDNGGRRYAWRRLTSKLPDSDMLRIDLAVSAPGGGEITLSMARPAQ